MQSDLELSIGVRSEPGLPGGGTTFRPLSSLGAAFGPTAADIDPDVLILGRTPASFEAVSSGPRTRGRPWSRGPSSGTT